MENEFEAGFVRMEERMSDLKLSYVIGFERMVLNNSALSCRTNV